MVYENGDIYKGSFVKDKRHGQGTILFADGRFFKGVFVNDLIKGKGIFKMNPTPDSIIIDGVFDNGILTVCQAKI
jgi:hypothetical protein